MLKTIKLGLLLFVALVISRLLPLPVNSEPLLGLAVLIPYLTKSNLAILMMPLVMFVSDLFLGFGSWIWFTYPALAIATVISQNISNKYIALIYSWFVWHISANLIADYPPLSDQALACDLRLFLSGVTVVVLYDIMRRLWQTAYQEV